MKEEREFSKKVNIRNLNSVILLSKKILKILYFLLLVVAIYAVTLIVKEWNVVRFVLSILRILLPLFIGIVLAWLFDPFVKWLQDKGMRRGLGATVVYVVFLGVIILILTSIVPIVYEQGSDFIKMVPEVVNNSKDYISDLFDKFDSVNSLNIAKIKMNAFNHVENFVTAFTEDLPSMAINTFMSFISGTGTIIVGLVIGFYLLLSFENVDNILTFLPRKTEKFTRELTHEINNSLRGYVIGAIFDSTLIFVITSIAFAIVGLKAPLLFGLFCGITNVIPYAGPYIGGAPAVLVGFSMSPTVGFLTLASIFVIQFIEGNFLQSLILSKTTKLHPVTIIIGLLVFGHLWGIIGMVVSTPIIATLKTIFKFLDEKYDILKFD